MDWIATNLSRIPPRYIGDAIGPSDYDGLMRLFREASRPRDRFATTLLLAKLGGTEVFQVFTNALGSEFEGKVADWRYMELTLHSLGWMAGASHEAREFVSMARDLDFWRSFRRWQLEPIEETVAEKWLTGTAWAAMGLGGLPTAGSVAINFEEEKEKVGANTKLDVYLMEGAFYDYLIKKSGRDQALRTWMGPHGFFDEYSEWRDSENGLPWKVWKESRRR